MIPELGGKMKMLGDTHRPTDCRRTRPTNGPTNRLSARPTNGGRLRLADRPTDHRSGRPTDGCHQRLTTGHSTVHRRLGICRAYPSRPTEPRGLMADSHETRRPTEEPDATLLATDLGSADSSDRRTAARPCQL